MDMENRKRKRKRISTQKKLLLALDGVLVVGVIVAAVVLATTLSGRGGNGDAQAAKPAAGANANAATPLETVAAVPSEGAAAQTVAVEGSAADAMHIDFTMLSDEGVPAVAYLCSEGTVINYPVVQNIDNEYYMARGANGKKDENGAIYLDSRNSNEFLDEQIVIFGNPMADGSMFGSLLSYRDEAYLAEHPSMYLYTPHGNYRIDIFASHTASPAMSNYPIWFTNAAARTDYIEAAIAQSSIKPSVTIAPDAKLICLVTSSDFDAGANARFVVHGVLTQL